MCVEVCMFNSWPVLFRLFLPSSDPEEISDSGEESYLTGLGSVGDQCLCRVAFE